jgi:hypothetical protein
MGERSARAKAFMNLGFVEIVEGTFQFKSSQVKSKSSPVMSSPDMASKSS